MTGAELDARLERAADGRRLWIELTEGQGLSRDSYVILAPSLNKECNYFGLLHLEKFLETVNAKSALFLTYDEKIIADIGRFSKKARALYFAREDAEKLMLFYCLYQFTDRLVILSLDEPSGRTGIELTERKGISVSEAVAVGVYGLREFETGSAVFE